jgi:hypothetical protein
MISFASCTNEDTYHIVSTAKDTITVMPLADYERVVARFVSGTMSILEEASGTSNVTAEKRLVIVSLAMFLKIFACDERVRIGSQRLL